MAGSERDRNYQRSGVEPQLCNDRESDRPGSARDKIKDAMRCGAERVTGNRRR